MRPLFVFFALAMLCAQPAFAGADEAENAVTAILFDANMENVSCAFRKDGFVDILFGVAVPEAEYVRIVEQIRAHPDVRGVLAGRGSGNYCKVP
jgi:hypothetical protein